MKKQNSPDPVRFSSNTSTAVWLTLFPWLSLALMSLVYSDQLPDPENSLKYLFYSALMVLIPSGMLLFKRPLGIPSESVNLIKWSGAIVITSLISALWSAYKWEALYEWSKLLLQAGGLVLWLIYFRNVPNGERNLFNSLLTALVLISGFAFMEIAPFLEGPFGKQQLHDLHSSLHSTFSNKNFLGETLVLMMPVFGIGFTMNEKSTKVLSGAALLIILGLLIFIQSLATIIATAIASAVIAAGYLIISARKGTLKKGKVLRLAAVLLAGIIITGIAAWRTGGLASYTSKVKLVAQYLLTPENTETNFTIKNDNSIFERMLLLKNSAKMIAEHPVTGVGISDFKIVFPKYGITGSHFLNTGRMRYEHPHNDYVFVWAETGIPGLVAWTGFLLFILWQCISGILSQKTDPNTSIRLLMILGGVTAFMIMSLFSYPRERYFSLCLLMMMGAYVNCLRSDKNRSPLQLPKKWVLSLLVIFSGSCWLHASHVRSEYYFKASQRFQFQRNYPEMLQCLNKASSRFQLDLTATPYSWYQGMAMYYSGDSLTAMRLYSQATEENPYHLQAWNDLAAMQEKTGSLTRALNSIQHALEINPYFPDALFNATMIHFRTGRTDSALYYLEKYPYQKLKPYKNLRDAILAEIDGRHLRASQDTALMRALNDTIIKDWHLLNRIYESNGKDTLLMINALENFRR